MRSAAAVAVALACFALVVVRAASAPSPSPSRTLTPIERAEILDALRAREREWADETARSFPADRWSQRDDFHGREFRFVSKVAHDRGVSVAEVLRAIDEDLHAGAAAAADAPDERHARAVPCKPRPFYD